MKESWGFEGAQKEGILTREQAEMRMKERILSGIEKNKPPLYTSFAVLLDHKGEPILFERKKDPHQGSFSLVGGKVDLSHLTDAPGSAMSAELQENGLESPTSALIREVTEEVYRDRLSENSDEMKHLLEPKRFAVVYDAVCNAYNFLFTASSLVDTPFLVSEREVGSVKGFSDLDESQMNPLTRFALHLLRMKDAPDDVTFGPIDRIVLPSDVLRYSSRMSDGLQSSELLEERGYYLEYEKASF